MQSGVDDTAAQHVVRTLRALELLAEGPQTQADLSRHLAVHRRTARRLLGRLVALGYAEAETGGQHLAYRPTPRLAVLGRRVADALDLVAIGRRHLASLDRTGANMLFIAALGPSGIWTPHTEQVDARTSLGYVERGAPLHATAAGKVFLSADDILLQGILTQELLAFTPSTLVTRADLLLELASVRAQGYAVENGEHLSGSRAAAAGVRNYVGKTVVALGATASNQTSLAAIGSHLREAALAFSREIGAPIDAARVTWTRDSRSVPKPD
jgi:IclR family pca regulon transcriptional regulator